MKAGFKTRPLTPKEIAAFQRAVDEAHDAKMKHMRRQRALRFPECRANFEWFYGHPPEQEPMRQ
jgi:hypothetical protein